MNSGKPRDPNATRRPTPEGGAPPPSRRCSDPAPFSAASPLAAYSVDALDVTRVRLHVALRCSAAEGCEPYLRIGVAFQGVSAVKCFLSVTRPAGRRALRASLPLPHRGECLRVLCF